MKKNYLLAHIIWKNLKNTRKVKEARHKGELTKLIVRMRKITGWVEAGFGMSQLL